MMKRARKNQNQGALFHTFTALMAAGFLFGFVTIGFAQTNVFPADGNVGIGTTSPGAGLVVENGKTFLGTKTLTADYQGDVVLFGNSDGSAAQAGSYRNRLILFGGGGQTRALRLYQSLGAGFIESSWGDLSLRTTGNNADISLIPHGTGDVLIPSGNFGIGTTSPGAGLVVENGKTFLGTKTLTANNESDVILFGNSDGTVAQAGSYRNRLILFGGGGQTRSLRIYQSLGGASFVESSWGDLKLRTTGNNADISLVPHGTGDVLITSGNVGIGTESPQSKLAVNGIITAREVVVEETGWPDFVFDKDYELMPLSRLEETIKQKGHLPDIPSADEVADKGVNLGEMQSRLLQKVEELTLYVIEQNKGMTEMKEEIISLQKENEILKKNLFQ